MDTSTKKDKLARFGRSMAMMLNRSMMYQKTHPMVKDSIKEVHQMAEILLPVISPLVFILNREQFYIDEEQLDPRINVKRIAHQFKAHGLQSISFEIGLTPGELDIFVDIFSAMTIVTKADTIRKDLLRRGAYNIKVNHVLYKKVTEDDQIVSREALKQVTPSMEDDDSASRKKFMDTLLETILTEEYANTLNIKSLMADPSLVSKNMIQADLASAEKLEPGGAGGPGIGGTGPGGPGSDPGTGGSGGGAGGGTPGTGGVEGAGAGGTGGRGPGGGSPASIGAGSGAPGTGGVEGAGAGGTGGGAAGGGSATGTAASLGAGKGGHGHMLLHQLDLMQQEVQKHLAGGGDISLEELADAVFEMKKQLFEDIQTQKTLGVAYANEDAILDNINQLTDQVIVQLIQEEYKNGKITTQRFAQIILRLIPDPKELKRLMPIIKTALLECGMPADAYLELVEELKHELQSEELSRIIEESSEAIGVDSEHLVQELKEDSGQAAKLIYLASEIRKGGGNESMLSDILVDYVEQMTREAAEKQEKDGGDEHLKKVISNVESTVLGQLSKMDVGDDVILRMEERINERMDSILDKMRVEWLQARAGTVQKEKVKSLTVLQTLEHNVGDDEELEEILKGIRAKVEAGEIEENNFSQIHAEITRQKQQQQKEAEGANKPEGVLSSNEFMFILEKEIARANRYGAPFSAMAFTFVNAKPNVEALDGLINTDTVMAAALEKMVNTIREVDYIGQIGKNKMVALLPMIPLDEAKKALKRVSNLLHSEPLMVKGVPVQLRVAGVVAAFDSEMTPDAHMFAKKLSNQLMDMVSRIKNIQVLF